MVILTGVMLCCVIVQVFSNFRFHGDSEDRYKVYQSHMKVVEDEWASTKADIGAKLNEYKASRDDYHDATKKFLDAIQALKQEFDEWKTQHP